jgi:deoxyhypusine synthase
MTKDNFLKDPVKHINIDSFDSTEIIEAMKDMSFTARDTAKAAEILNMMIGDDQCTIILCIAGSTSAAGCMQIYVDMVKYNMVDVIVASGASIVDMDFFEALGFNHYKGSPFINDMKLRELYIDRIYDTFIDEEQLQICDNTIKEIADSLTPKPYSSREFISEMGKYLVDNAKKPDSLVQAAYENNVPIFCPAFSDSSAGFGLVKHQVEHEESHVSVDSVKDFRELTEIKIKSPVSGLFIVGGGVPKNFAQDTVVCAEVLGKSVEPHKYAVQITVADVRDGACSGSTLKEACSWGKVSTGYEQMVYAEATSVLPLIISFVYHTQIWKARCRREWSRIFT